MSFEALMAELKTGYVASLPDKAKTIQTQVETGNAADLRDAFHKLKGTGRTYGVPEVSDLARLVEELCATQPHEAPAAARLAAAILHDIHAAHSQGRAFALTDDARFLEIQALHPRS